MVVPILFSEVKSDLIIRVGDLNNKEPDSDEEEFEVEEIFMHEGYDSKYYFLNFSSTQFHCKKNLYFYDIKCMGRLQLFFS